MPTPTPIKSHTGKGSPVKTKSNESFSKTNFKGVEENTTNTEEKYRLNIENVDQS